ncbi:MAG: hypothetical protein WC477_05580 [Patescibacteria group bacterium]
MHILSSEKTSSVIVRYVASSDSIICSDGISAGGGEPCGDYLTLFYNPRHTAVGFSIRDWGHIIHAELTHRNKSGLPALDQMRDLALRECVEMTRRCQERENGSNSHWLAYDDALTLARDLVILAEDWTRPLIHAMRNQEPSSTRARQNA